MSSSQYQIVFNIELNTILSMAKQIDQVNSFQLKLKYIISKHTAIRIQKESSPRSFSKDHKSIANDLLIPWQQ